jgi:predicted nuclease of predicted toxin-antitoxin system
VEVAHEHGCEAHHVSYLGMSGWKDHELLQPIQARDYTFVTNNGRDFRRLYQSLPLHAGLIILLPSVSLERQQRLFAAALQSIQSDSLVNEVIEVNEIRVGNLIRIVVERYALPGSKSDTTNA